MFINHYDCPRCGTAWTDYWSCMCDDDCPECGCRHISPTASEEDEEADDDDDDEA